VVNTVGVVVSMPAVQVVVSLTLTIYFGFANRDDTFDGRAFYVLFKKLCLGLGLRFSVLGHVTKIS